MVLDYNMAFYELKKVAPNLQEFDLEIKVVVIFKSSFCRAVGFRPVKVTRTSGNVFKVSFQRPNLPCQIVGAIIDIYELGFH